MKTQLITLIIIVSSIFSLSSVASANDRIAEKSSVIPTSILSLDLNEVVIDDALEIEDWMVNDENWKHTNEMTYPVDSEKDLQIENWMTDEAQWELVKLKNTNVVSFENAEISFHVYQMKNDKEQALRIESWMIDDEYWNL